MADGIKYTSRLLNLTNRLDQMTLRDVCRRYDNELGLFSPNQIFAPCLDRTLKRNLSKQEIVFKVHYAAPGVLSVWARI